MPTGQASWQAPHSDDRKGISEERSPVDALEQRRDDGADRTGVGRAVGLPAHAAPHRAGVEAGAAADAVERLLHVGAAQGRAAAVEDHQVQLLGAVGLVGAPAAR